MIEELKYDLCEGCGEIKPRGLFDIINHSCPANTVTLYAGKFGVRHFRELFEKFEGTYIDPFDGLLDFKYFKAMPNYETASELDKRIYAVCRESDIRSMKRLRAYLELEKQFDVKH